MYQKTSHFCCGFDSTDSTYQCMSGKSCEFLGAFASTALMVIMCFQLAADAVPNISPAWYGVEEEEPGKLATEGRGLRGSNICVRVVSTL